jgi:hypothetical protein
MVHLQLYTEKEYLKIKMISKISFMLFGNGQIKITGVNDFDYLNTASYMLF